jgi:hypothetical protein
VTAFTVQPLGELNAEEQRNVWVYEIFSANALQKASAPAVPSTVRACRGG